MAALDRCLRVLVLPTAEAVATAAAARIADLVAARPDATLGLATGETMRPVHEGLVEAHRAGLSLAGLTTFNLDEYVGLGPEHPASFAAFMRATLFDLTDIQ